MSENNYLGELNRKLAEHFEKQYDPAVQQNQAAGSYLQYSGNSFYLVETATDGVEKKRTEVPRSALPVLKRIGVTELHIAPVGIESKLRF